jgi:nucleoid-associated protein YgaU
VVPRKPKLIAAAAVLAVGLGLAWPWRRSETMPTAVLPMATPSTSFGSVPPPQAISAPAAAPHSISATTIGVSGTPVPSNLASAGRSPESSTVAEPAALGTDQRALPAVEDAEALAASAQERIYIVQEGDSLERLAQRYLGDEGRAVEIFDLNRQVLENPHILPIGRELKLPLSGANENSTPAP